MATIGQALTAPENGWVRFDDKHPNIEYVGTVSLVENNTNFYENGYTFITGQSEVTFYKFNFTGTKIRLIGRLYSTYSDKVQVKIDGDIVEYYSSKLASNINVGIIYENLNLENKVHTIEVITTNTGITTIDAVDLEIDAELLPYKVPSNKFLILSSDRKVISHENDGVNGIVKYIPNNSEQNFINHGLDKSAQIDLNAPMTNKVFIEQSPTVLGSGKVFKKTIDTSKIPIKSVSIK